MLSCVTKLHFEIYTVLQLKRRYNSNLYRPKYNVPEQKGDAVAQ